jgi:hypothetical protein
MSKNGLTYLEAGKELIDFYTASIFLLGEFDAGI